MTNIERHILLLGSGYVAAPCVEYLIRRPENKITIASRSYDNAITLSKKYPGTSPAQLDIDDEASLDNLVCRHDIVISLIPYIHHATVIKSAIKFNKNVVTTSYVSPAMLELDEAAKEAGITVMNEIGLDPGIDHLYAIKTIDEVHNEGGKVLSFLSYCGGLPAPEASNNPLGYKFSWSSRGVLLALRNQARFLQDGQIVTVEGSGLMKSAKPIHVYPAFNVVGYANRDSSHYPQRYNMPECETCLRGTLRYQVFPSFVQTLTDLGFLSDEPKDYLTSESQEITWRQVLANVLNTTDDEQSLSQAILAKSPINSESEIERIFNGFKWLGLFSDTVVTKRGSNLLDTLCATLEQKMAYGEGERDMVLLQHKFKVQLADGTIQTRTSTLLEYGTPNGHSAMAFTVGVPCGIATQLVLDNVINQKGVLAPMSAEINQPLIEAIEKEGIRCIEEIL